MLSVYLFAIYLVKCSFAADHGPVDCSMGSKSCDSCHAAYPFCYWCEGQCRKYYGKNIAQIECAGEIMYESCIRKNEKERLGKMLKLLESLKQAPHPPKRVSPLNEYLGNRYELLVKPTESAKKSRLLRVLKLLKLLAALEAKKKQNARKSQQIKETDNKLEHKYFTKMLLENKETIDKIPLESASKKNHEVNSNNDLDALLSLVDGKGTKTPPPHRETKSFIVDQKHTKAAETIQPTKQVIQGTTAKVTKKLAKTQKQAEPNSSNISTEITLVNSSLVTIKPTTKSRYCELFEKEEECNNDHECSWCNILAECIGRNKEDFKYCAGNEKRSSLEDGYDDADSCLGLNDCKACTSKGKCFWCEKTKSCHTYPFFGFIPHNCPANMWYYKECDVQLAIFIILFPLLMILLSMVIFYFCLRYCYYRKRTLKVQLFEKPELFERRKGKKVYFVGGDEEDDESRSEQIRKKYNLPHEKEPLISP